jgi:hypothetical protein
MALFNRAASTVAWPSRQRSISAHKQRRQGKISPWRGEAAVDDEVGQLRWIGSFGRWGTLLRRIGAEGLTRRGFSTEAGGRPVGNGGEEGRPVVVGDD